MIRQAAFVGELADVTLDCANRAALVHAALDVHDLGRFFTGIGVPLPPQGERTAQEQPPCLVLLACRRPAHPEGDEDVIAEACLRTLLDLVLGGTVSFGPALTQQLAGLLQALQGRPDILSGAEMRR